VKYEKKYGYHDLVVDTVEIKLDRFSTMLKNMDDFRMASII